MLVPVLVTVAAVAVALVVRLVAGRSRRDALAAGGADADASMESWTATDARTRPDDLDLSRFGLVPPVAGTLLAVVFTHPACESCRPLARRLVGIDAIVTAEVDVTEAPATVRAAGVASVPTLVLVDHEGGVVGSWIGTPLAGTVEETVRRTLGA